MLVAQAFVETWHWDEDSFVRAWEAGVFGDDRVELVEGEIWPVSIGEWHGAVTANVSRLLPNGFWRVTIASLPASGSVPDPDLWVRRRGASPVARLGSEGHLTRWDPVDVAVVVEVADTSYLADIQVKGRIYGSAGYPTYWVVHRDGVEVFTEPYDRGYRQQRTYPPGESVPVPYRTDMSLAVNDLLDAD